MKKVFSLLLAVLMLVSALPVAYAAGTNDYTAGTAVVYTAANNEDYSITIPAALAPGQGGTVTLQGTWPSNKTITVTADETVTLTNTISGADAKTLKVNFEGISEAGSDTSSQKFEEPVSVDPIEDALFGVWNGHFYYNVEAAIQKNIAATFNDGTELTWEELKLEENGTKYGYTASAITDTSIGDTAFEGCTSLTSIDIPDSVTNIGENAFSCCNSLTNIDIPDSVTSIGNGALQNCTSLTSITIPESVTSIGISAFNGCNSLTSIDIPDSVTSIGDYAFAFCDNLTSITIPDSVTSIGNSAFNGCKSLTSITIPDSVTSIGNSAFNGCNSLTSIDIPDSVTSIGDWAFAYCEDLTSITIPDSITSIGDWAFSGCYSLTSVTIPDGVTSIGGNTFSNCTSLTSITIPDSVTSIGRAAFDSCNSLTTVNYTGTEEQWTALLKNISSGNNYLINASINYNYVAEHTL